MLVLLAAALLPSVAAVAARSLLLTEGTTCDALTTGSLQFKGSKVGTVEVTSSDGCCDACSKMPGCQMWFLKGTTCEMFGLDKVRPPRLVSCFILVQRCLLTNCC